MQGIGLFKTDAHDVACLQDELNNDHILNGGPLHCHDLLDQVCAVDHRSFLQILAGVRKGCGVHDGCPAGTLPDAADDVDGAERFRQRHEVDAGVKQAVHRTGDTQQHTDDTARAKKLGATITYDPNYRANLWKSKEDAIAQMKAPLPLVDILKVSDEELPLLTGTTDCESGTAQLAQNGIRLIFVTLGANGVFYRFGDKTGHVAGVPCKVGDTNGAGDTFFGAALSKLCKEKLDTLTVDKLEGILAFANKAASITTSRHGAIPAMPTLAEVEG